MYHYAIGDRKWQTKMQFTAYTVAEQSINRYEFSSIPVDKFYWATVCKTVRPMLTDRCLSCLSVTLVYYGQTVGWIKMKLGTGVGLGPGHIVLDGDPAPPKKGHSSPTFRPMSIVAKRSAISATAEYLLNECNNLTSAYTG